MSKIKTFKTLEAAIEAAKAEHATHGWFVSVLPIHGKGTYMLSASAAADQVFSIGEEEKA